MTDAASRSELAYWIRTQRDAQREMRDAKAAALHWLERARLAKRAGNDALVQAAAEQMREAKTRYAAAELRAQEADVQIASSRQSVRSMPENHAVFAEQLLSEFELMGIDVEGDALEQALQQESVRQTVQEMKQRAGIGQPVDALSLLRQRLNAEE